MTTQDDRPNQDKGTAAAKGLRFGHRHDELPLWAEGVIFPGMVAYRRGDHALGLTLLGLATGGFMAGLLGSAYGILALAKLGTSAALGSAGLGLADAVMDGRRQRELDDILAREKDTREKDGGGEAGR